MLVDRLCTIRYNCKTDVNIRKQAFIHLQDIIEIFLIILIVANERIKFRYASVWNGDSRRYLSIAGVGVCILFYLDISGGNAVGPNRDRTCKGLYFRTGYFNDCQTIAPKRSLIFVEAHCHASPFWIAALRNPHAFTNMYM